MKHAATLLSADLRLAGRLDERFFALLAALEATGSINRAARTAGLSYKGAWLLLETACNLANTALLETATGGAGGGGTRLTPAAHALLQAWTALRERHHAFLREQEARLLHEQPVLAGLLRRLQMKTTARNQFIGRIAAIEREALLAQVTLALASGQTLVASLTRAAADRLKLKKGQEALALIKASSVVLVADQSGWQLATANQLAGTVSRIERGAVSSLVVLTLPGGAHVSATVTNEGVEALALKIGSPCSAVFKASAVMLATQG